ncbi:MAG: Gfo/Idh/MocA family oxidoreductase [Spirochaetota bacterium]|nr:MAG: Gfo/Idh/MocA family oxidoreductase [Spirochaetota bacterium]
MAKTINVGMVGYKFMGKAHSNAWRQVAVFYDPPFVPVLKAICGRNEKGVKEAKEKYGWESYETSWKDLIKRDDIDIVDINTPNSSHAEIAIAAAEAGKHVFLEKPMAMNLKEAKAMAQAVKRAGVKHMVGFNYRKFPALAYAKELIERGKIGRVYHFRSMYLQDWIVDPDFALVWRLDKTTAGTGAIGDLGAHIIDMAQFLIGDISSITATTETFIRERAIPEESGGLSAKGGTKRGKVTVDDAFVALARFKNGALGTFECTRFAIGHKNWGFFEINGSKGSMRFNLERSNELEYLSADEGDEQGFKTILVTNSTHPFMSAWWPPGHMLGWEHSHTIQVYHLLDSIGKDRLPEPSFFDGAKNQAVLEAIEKSSQDGKWHDIEEVKF